ncbi:o-succinylbenzoate--CoA ligase [Oceanobacillus iheyensis]|uniref:2-succinylbenzoate--CoA ligase n=1 Tax=Oceanobacillus iheyensis (strain DSM 14371 / CIP 107618 / JCM 11309 / KCTC 3954 / HTE831) TaxID=221109 RepID=MENE_OCEIH|nr:o-succinylbenzoate--CoA ligase [Oceanobacillus iheyensis]Q8ENZ7.1 RecName: Full=2-succinylbenzoate--CoA ligase; AltName: Full=o-succinylbenzoyl-CoA synthetase; Short=OSB-CoA synthetase [Oceanobacillus iheyensis HTE831]BAC14278.1 O-succinylbenzoate-CoA ligase [Oceanobacillus iheyensis HTE831]
MSETTPHWLTKRADLSPDKKAIEFEDGSSITYLELFHRSQSYARKLGKLGFRQGDHIAILSTNCAEMIQIIYACSYLGAVAVLLNTKLTINELNQQLLDSDAKVIITSESFKASEFVLQRMDYNELESVTEDTSIITLKSEIYFDDIFTMMYTSGTTGFPKAVQQTFGNHWWSATSSALNLGLHDNDKWLIPLPLFHVSGLSTMLKSVIYGMPIYVLEKFEVEKVHNAIMDRKVTIVSVVTVMVQRLIKRLGNHHYPNDFRCMLLGGGPAPKSLLEQAKLKNIPVFQSYGMTETSSQIVTLTPEDALKKIGSAGKPLFPAQLKIAHNENNPNQIGEILVKGPMVTKGYYKRAETNKEVFENNWLHTGDMGYLDEQGYLYVVDRRNDLIISGGENIYPSEIENVLVQIEGIEEAGVKGSPNEEWGMVPIAFIVCSRPISENEIAAHLEKYLAKYKRPKEIHVVNELPRNAANKLVRHNLGK